MRVADARPGGKKRAAEIDGEETPKERRAKREKSARSMKEEGTIDGVELPKGRKVKRGWVETEGEKAKLDSKVESRNSVRRSSNSQEKPECLFKTKLPSGVTQPEGTISKKKSKLSKNGETVVREFANTTKALSFLREDAPANGDKFTTEFVEGKGWVAADGSLVEAVPRSKRHKPQAKPEEKSLKPDIKVTRPVTRSSKSAAEVLKPSEQDNSGSRVPSATSSVSTPESEDEAQEPTCLASLSITRSSPSPPPASSPTTQAPHPLESLFKRPAPKSTLSTSTYPNDSKSKSKPPPLKPSLELSTSFTFFGPDDESINGDLSRRVVPEDTQSSSIEALKVPQTPFTRQDFRDRQMRSAAPTPDTAAPGKSGFGKVWGSQSPSPSDDEDPEELGEGNREDEDDAGSTDRAVGGSKEGGKEKPAEKRSEFEKWFWEHRGETNRHWKKMRREALKGRRHEANKRRGASTAK